MKEDICELPFTIIWLPKNRLVDVKGIVNFKGHTLLNFPTIVSEYLVLNI